MLLLKAPKSAVTCYSSPRETIDPGSTVPDSKFE